MIPVNDVTGRIGQVYFGGAEIDLPSGALLALHLMALYAFDRALQLRGRSDAPQLALTLREREVLTLVAVGWSYEEIAGSLINTARTVKAHIKSCCEKPNAATRTQAVMIALRDRLISP